MFKPGDLIECVEEVPYGREYGVLGQDYVVAGIGDVGGQMWIEVNGMRLNPERFKLILPEAEPQVPESISIWIVIYDNGDGPSVSTYLTEKAGLYRVTKIREYGWKLIATKKLTVPYENN